MLLSRLAGLASMPICIFASSGQVSKTGSVTTSPRGVLVTHAPPLHISKDIEKRSQTPCDSFNNDSPKLAPGIQINDATYNHAMLMWLGSLVTNCESINTSLSVVSSSLVVLEGWKARPRVAQADFGVRKSMMPLTMYDILLTSTTQEAGTTPNMAPGRFERVMRAPMYLSTSFPWSQDLVASFQREIVSTAISKYLSGGIKVSLLSALSKLTFHYLTCDLLNFSVTVTEMSTQTEMISVEVVCQGGVVEYQPLVSYQ